MSYWLHQSYRDTKKFTFDWLVQEASKRDIIVIFHPIAISIDANIRNQYEQLLALPVSLFKPAEPNNWI